MQVQSSSFLIGLLATLAGVPAAMASEPVPLIFDTDLGNDVDDALALGLIHALQSHGQCQLLEAWGVLTPIVQDGVIFNPCRWRGFDAPVSFVAVRPPAEIAPDAENEIVLDLDGNDAGASMLLEPGDELALVAVNSLPAGSGANAVFSNRRMFFRGGKWLYCIGQSPSTARPSR